MAERYKDCACGETVVLTDGTCFIDGSTVHRRKKPCHVLEIDPTDPLHTPTDEPPHICTYTTDAQGVRSCQVCRRIEDQGER